MRDIVQNFWEKKVCVNVCRVFVLTTLKKRLSLKVKVSSTKSKLITWMNIKQVNIDILEKLYLYK